jgi:hypothetical protein
MGFRVLPLFGKLLVQLGPADVGSDSYVLVNPRGACWPTANDKQQAKYHRRNYRSHFSSHLAPPFSFSIYYFLFSIYQGVFARRNFFFY